MNTTEEDALAAGRDAVATIQPRVRELSHTARIIAVEGAVNQNAAAILAERESRQSAMRNHDAVLRKDFGDALISDRASAQQVFDQFSAIVNDLDARTAFLERRYVARRARINAHWWRRFLCWLVEGSEPLEQGAAELRAATLAQEPTTPVLSLAPERVEHDADTARSMPHGEATPTGPRLVQVVLLCLLAGLGASGCAGDPTTPTPTVVVAVPNPVASPLLSIAVRCPGTTYWAVAMDGVAWNGSMALGAFGPVDSLGWVVDWDHVPLPTGVHAYTFTQLSGFMVNGGVPLGIVATILTTPDGRGSGALRCT